MNTGNWDVKSNYQFGNNILEKKLFKMKITQNIYVHFIKKNTGMQQLQN